MKDGHCVTSRQGHFKGCDRPFLLPCYLKMPYSKEEITNSCGVVMMREPLALTVCD